ncbi:hypothetical protein C0J52_21057, partial [Blattella germanica]
MHNCVRIKRRRTDPVGGGLGEYNERSCLQEVLPFCTTENEATHHDVTTTNSNYNRARDHQ